MKCDNCKKKAVYNLQNCWHLYFITDEGNYELDREWEGDTTKHYCEKHAEEAEEAEVI
jgi:hypothetical protein